MQVKVKHLSSAEMVVPTEKERRGIEALAQKRWHRAEKIFDAVVYENFDRVWNVGVYACASGNSSLNWRYMTGHGVKVKSPKLQAVVKPARCPSIDKSSVTSTTPLLFESKQEK